MSNFTCTHEDCETPVKGRWLCKLHYDRAKRQGLLGGPKCKVSGCEGAAYSNGMCTKHEQRFRKHGDVNREPVVVNGGACSVDECQKTATAAGLCPMHYRRLRLYGTTDAPLKRPASPRKPCTIDGCAGPQRGRGYCGKHYRRFQTHGDPHMVKTTAKPPVLCSVPGCDGVARTRSFCRTHYSRWQRHGDAMWSPEPWESRFWAKVEKTGTCWLWRGVISMDGYGKVRAQGKNTGAHRVSWELSNGPIPEGMQIDHLCHVTNCVRPDHLRVATPRMNSDNRKGANRGNKSGFRGVTWSNQAGKWQGRYMVNYVPYEVGYFDDPQEAFEAVEVARHETKVRLGLIVEDGLAA